MSAMGIPADDPRRHELNDEVHARPPEPLEAPVRVSFIALVSDWENREAERLAIAALVAPFGIAPPPPAASHFSADLGAFRLRWERHTEFARYQFTVDGAETPFPDTALLDVTMTVRRWAAQASSTPAVPRMLVRSERSGCSRTDFTPTAAAR